MSVPKTYETVCGPPPMAWDVYQEIIRQAWITLLESDVQEREIQDFLERHPCMIPGPFGLIGASVYPPYPSAVISKPVLPDFTGPAPDFMWFARDSETIYPVLIEIGAPSKPWFTDNDRQQPSLSQARDRITAWKMWFQTPLNLTRLREHYALDVRGETIRPLFALIYGRRSEANATPERQLRRSTLERNDEFLMTYDRLVPQEDAREFYSVRVERSGYRALFAPPTATNGPFLAHHRAKILGKYFAVQNSPYFNDARRAFYLARLPYWDDWAFNGQKGIICAEDRE